MTAVCCWLQSYVEPSKSENRSLLKGSGLAAVEWHEVEVWLVLLSVYALEGLLAQGG